MSRALEGWLSNGAHEDFPCEPVGLFFPTRLVENWVHRPEAHIKASVSVDWSLNRFIVDALCLKVLRF